MKGKTDKGKNTLKNKPIDGIKQLTYLTTLRKIFPLFPLIMCLSMTALILVLAHPESIYSDENSYLLLAKSILNGEHYNSCFPDARPLIPSLIALFLFIGFDIYTIQLLIPLIFMNLTTIVTYFLAKTMYGEREAIIATLFLFTFPFFWRCGLSMLLDIPLAALSSLFILFLYFGVEKEKKYLLISAIFFVLAFLTKASAILLIPPALLYLLITDKRLVLTKEFIISVVIPPMLFLFVFTLFHIFLSANIGIAGHIYSYQPFSILEVLSIGYAPLLLFGFFSISREKRTIFLGSVILVFITFFMLTSAHLRHFSPLFPIFGIFVARGYINLRDRLNFKKVVDLVIIIFLIISIMNSFYFVDSDKNARWGVVTLSDHVNALEGNGTIASDYNAGYISVVTGKNVIRTPYHYQFNDTLINVEEFWSCVKNKSHPNSSRYAELYKSGQINPSFVYYFDKSWIIKNGVEYVILSIYATDKSSYNHPKYAWIKVPFIKIPSYYSNAFHSELYELCEKNYERVDEIYKERQLIFIIYKV